MAQYPNDKDPQSSWLPSDLAQGPYTSRDGAPGEHASSSQYSAPPGLPPGQQGYYQPAQGHYPAPQGPPPNYSHNQTHPPDGSALDAKGAQETYLSPPARALDSPYAPAPAPAPAPESSGKDAKGEGGLMMSLASFFGNTGPPPMWNRTPPPANVLAYDAFAPMCLISNDKSLVDGFPELPPPCPMNPHPFATHDVTEEDWKRFLVDVKKGAGLSPGQRIRSSLIPTVTGMNFITGFFATRIMQKNMEFKNRHAAGDVVDHWNHYFFGPRRMEVVLCQASERLSGRFGAAPVGDPNQTRMAHGLRQRRDDWSRGESFYDDRSYSHGRGRGRGRRGRGGSDSRMAQRARGEDQEPYQLFVTSV